MSGREIVLDTETTGLDPAKERIIEIACVELINRLPSGRTKRWYLNPEQPVQEAAFQIHGLSDEFLADKPKFAAVAGEFLEFIGDAKLVIHNAEFDLGFVNAELKRVARDPLDRARAIDTLAMARRMFPGERVSLDALCQRFAIDNSHRSVHGALLDAALLADVYLDLTGGRQATMALNAARVQNAGLVVAKTIRPPRPHAPSAAELAAHAEFLKSLKDPIWLG
jgi:DNA polymerase III subunit epsilon